MRRIAKETQTELIVKALFATIFGMGLSHLVGWSMSLTITFACILISYTNRGFFGAKDYYRRRLQTQVLMAILLYFTVVLLHYFFPGMASWLVFFIPCVFWGPLFLYLCYAYQFTPLNLTATYSLLMIMNSALKDSSYFYWRVILTFLGMIMGWGFAMVYPFRSKVDRTRESLKNISLVALQECASMRASGTFGLSDSYKALLEKDIPEEMADITAYLNVVYQDTKTFKYKPFKKDIPAIKAEFASTANLIEFLKYLEANKPALNGYDDFFKEELFAAMDSAYALHKDVLSGSEETLVLPEKELHIGAKLDSNIKVFALSSFIKYKNEIWNMVSASNRAAAQPAPKG